MKPDRWDLLVYAGAAIVALGVGLIYLPAGVIVAGAAAVWIGLVGAASARIDAAKGGRS